MLGNSLTSGIILENSGSEVVVGKGPSEKLLTGYGEKVSGGHSPRHRGPPGNPYPDYSENHEETTQSGV